MSKGRGDKTREHQLRPCGVPAVGCRVGGAGGLTSGGGGMQADKATRRGQGLSTADRSANTMELLTYTRHCTTGHSSQRLR
jgi:hypothetical protein